MQAHEELVFTDALTMKIVPIPRTKMTRLVTSDSRVVQFAREVFIHLLDLLPTHERPTISIERLTTLCIRLPTSNVSLQCFIDENKVSARYEVGNDIDYLEDAASRTLPSLECARELAFMHQHKHRRRHEEIPSLEESSEDI